MVSRAVKHVFDTLVTTQLLAQQSHIHPKQNQALILVRFWQKTTCFLLNLYLKLQLWNTMVKSYLENWIELWIVALILALQFWFISFTESQPSSQHIYIKLPTCMGMFCCFSFRTAMCSLSPFTYVPGNKRCSEYEVKAQQSWIKIGRGKLNTMGYFPLLKQVSGLDFKWWRYSNMFLFRRLKRW